MVLRENAAKGLFLGLAIGDAMGSPIEFEKKRVKENYVRSYLEGGFHKVTKGEFTDDKKSKVFWKVEESSKGIIKEVIGKIGRERVRGAS